jgi:hypothetical protein
MELSQKQVENDVMENFNRMNKMGMVIKSCQMAMIFGVNLRIIRYGERESDKRTEYCTMKNMKKATL